MNDEREVGGGMFDRAGAAGDGGAGGSLKGLAIRVFTIQVIVLVLLWLLQSNFGSG